MIRLSDIVDFQKIDSFDPFLGSREEDIKEGRVFVYTIDGEACGFITMARAGLLGRPYVQYIAVSPCCQREGIAGQLLGYIEHKYSKERLFVSTESSNTPMRNLLLKRKYKPAGTISGANLSGASELYYYKEKSG